MRRFYLILAMAIILVAAYFIMPHLKFGMSLPGGNLMTQK